MRLSSGDRLFIGSIYVFLVLLAFVAFYPFWNAAVISFNSGTDTMQGGVTFWPREFTLENYKVVFKDERLIDGFIISIFRTIVGTLLSVMATAILAYGISKPQLSGRNVYMVLCIITMYFSGGLIPSYLLIRELGLMNTFWVMVVPGIINVWNMIIFRTFFSRNTGRAGGIGPNRRIFQLGRIVSNRTAALRSGHCHLIAVHGRVPLE